MKITNINPHKGWLLMRIDKGQSACSIQPLTKILTRLHGSLLWVAESILTEYTKVNNVSGSGSY